MTGEDEPGIEDADAGDGRLARLAAALGRGEGDAAAMASRLLVVLAAVLVPLGILLVVLGWWGASRTPNDYEQIPYLISGGQLGGTLAVVGALCYFGQWIAASVREQRVQGQAIVDALARLEDALRPEGLGAPIDAPDQLVATARGSLAHRPSCAVVAGKRGLRDVTGAGLARCQLCAPEGPPVSAGRRRGAG